jgi:hypothetical protein
MALARFLKHTLLAATVLTLLSACKDNRLLPTSGGTPYDVLVVDDHEHYVAECLQAEAPGLPQGEPSFNVMTVRKSRLNGTLLLSRSIVVLDIDSQRHHRPTVRYSRNVYAEPQLTVRVNAPSMAALRQSRCMEVVAQLLTKHEMNAAITRLRRAHNQSAEEEIKKKFGCTMLIPADMKINVKGRDFIWLSDNAPTGMRSICIYASENRDSVMKANLKGEIDGTYMATTPHSTIATHTTVQGRPTTIRRGLWEMQGDAMGGPYVSHTTKNPKNGRTVVAEAFVYAPETRKRNRLRQTEAALYTLSFEGQHSAAAH